MAMSPPETTVPGSRTRVATTTGRRGPYWEARAPALPASRAATIPVSRASTATAAQYKSGERVRRDDRRTANLLQRHQTEEEVPLTLPVPPMVVQLRRYIP